MGQACHKSQPKSSLNPTSKSFPTLQQPLLSNLLNSKLESNRNFITELTSIDTGEKLRRTELVIRDLVKKKKPNEIFPAFLEIYKFVSDFQPINIKEIDEVVGNLKKYVKFFEESNADFLEKNSKTYSMEFQLEVLAIFCHYLNFKSENDRNAFFFLDRNDRFFFERFTKIMNKCFEEYGLVNKSSSNNPNEAKVIVNDYLKGLYVNCDKKIDYLSKCDLDESEEEVNKPDEKKNFDDRFRMKGRND